jgi:hypothetical protein
MITSKNQLLLFRCAAPCVSCFNHRYNYYAAMQLLGAAHRNNCSERSKYCIRCSAPKYNF